MTSKEALYTYLGKPSQYTFNLEDYKGPRGLRSVIGLRHHNLAIAGNVLFNRVQDYFGIELDRWTFLYELGLWCKTYVKEEEIQVGKQTIICGQIKHVPTRYYCIPAEALSQYEEESSVAN